MELRRVADALLRSNASSPLTTFLTPSLLPQSSRAVTLSTRRAICTTQSKRAGFLRPQTTTSATPRTSRDNDTTSKDQSSDSRPETLSWASLGNERPRSSPESSAYGLGGFGTNNARSRDFAMDGGNSATELLSAIAEKERARQKRPGRFDISQMMDPAGASTSPTKVTLGAYDDLSLATLAHLTPPKPAKPPMRLNPTAGRSVTLTAGIDLGRGIRLLEQSCARNKVKRDSGRQRFHERPGLKRKRMKREGWRSRFADGFRAVVTRVKQLQKQGW